MAIVLILDVNKSSINWWPNRLVWKTHGYARMRD